MWSAGRMGSKSNNPRGVDSRHMFGCHRDRQTTGFGHGEQCESQWVDVHSYSDIHEWFHSGWGYHSAVENLKVPHRSGCLLNRADDQLYSEYTQNGWMRRRRYLVRRTWDPRMEIEIPRKSTCLATNDCVRQLFQSPVCSNNASLTGSNNAKSPRSGPYTPYGTESVA